MVLLEFSMSPMDKGESVSPWVSKCLRVVDESGLHYRLNPMGTVLEGDWDQVFGVVKQCFEVLQRDCHRISVSIKVDYRRGRQKGLESKIAAVENTLGKPMKQ
jgi:uncharacterized protein (TIGR00106 family)